VKTTIEVQDDLLERAKRVARREGTTLRVLIEEGIRLALKTRQRRTAAAPFRMRTFEGEGLTPEFSGAGWERIRDEIYRDRR
jgi:predicted transcriptional regulator